MKTMTKRSSSRLTTRGQNDGEKLPGKIVHISAPNFANGRFHIIGLRRLVICRFSEEARRSIIESQIEGSAGKTKRVKKKVDPEQLFKASRYYSSKGWEGFHAAAIRNGMISACRLVDLKMTIAKMCIFTTEDGFDKFEPQIPIIRIQGDAVMQQDAVRNRNTMQYSIATRAAYHDWEADVKLRWDADRFTLNDVSNLLARVGLQVGIGVGRPDSKDSAGMGWGLFKIAQSKEEA